MLGGLFVSQETLMALNKYDNPYPAGSPQCILFFKYAEYKQVAERHLSEAKNSDAAADKALAEAKKFEDAIKLLNAAEKATRKRK